MNSSVRMKVAKKSTGQGGRAGAGGPSPYQLDRTIDCMWWTGCMITRQDQESPRRVSSRAFIREIQAAPLSAIATSTFSSEYAFSSRRLLPSISACSLPL